MEKVVIQQILNHFDSQNVIPMHQSTDKISIQELPCQTSLSTSPTILNEEDVLP